MPKNVIRYIHPVLGEQYIDRNSNAYDLYQEKKFDVLNQILIELNLKCYGKKL
jgi:hypothetical protein